ncbi:hypothetical protein F1559_001360 [Cyanidiococcus yangmingshanensis]|uniref:NAD(P)-binding domain-containing protein n=1 Tax=Cyanidiococcus yangmingshanensis TaxID=2690220 RepID=A0A7J7IG19_9RHOD|nr:hypothetical protein F1559_001360 [Cyanidiococcus yangmingshanensis]
MEQTESQVAQVRSKERVPSETVQTAVSLGTVAVFGASGRTGIQVLRQLCAQGCCRQVRAIVRDAARLETELATWKQPSTASPVTVQVKAVGDLTQLDVRSLSDLVSDVDAIIWVAGATGGRGGIETPPAALDEATLRRLCDALALQPSTPSSEHRVTFRSPEEMADVLDFGRGRIVADAFTSVDDVVMGGLSSSGLIYDEREALGIFAGTVTTDGGGGFCHVRCDASMVAPAQRFGDVSLLTSEENGCRVSYWDLSSYDGLAVVVRGDGRRYKLNLKTTAEPETVFQQEFSTSGDLPPGTFETHFLPFADFVPVRRGLPLYGSGPVTYAMQLDPSRIRSIGLVYSKVAIGGGPAIDFMPGSFRLACRRISAYRQVPPRLIVLSSAAVTRPYWSPLKRQAYPELAQVPIVKLNPFGVLGHKLAGEDAVRTLVSHRSSLGAPYTIVRAVGLNDGDDPSFPGAATGELRFGQGDLMVGKISRTVPGGADCTPAARTGSVLQDI